MTILGFGDKNHILHRIYYLSVWCYDCPLSSHVRYVLKHFHAIISQSGNSIKVKLCIFWNKHTNIVFVAPTSICGVECWIEKCAITWFTRCRLRTQKRCSKVMRIKQRSVRFLFNHPVHKWCESFQLMENFSIQYSTPQLSARGSNSNDFCLFQHFKAAYLQKDIERDLDVNVKTIRTLQSKIQFCPIKGILWMHSILFVSINRTYQ